MTFIIYVFLSGVMMMGSLVISLFFLRFWKSTGESLFGYFSLAFAMLGIERAALILLPIPVESSAMVYVIRLIAFSLLAIAIVKKNREGKGKFPMV